MLPPYLLIVSYAALCLAQVPSAPQPAPHVSDLPPQREADTLPQDPGIYGSVRPQLADVVLPDTLVHGDLEGRAMHQLLDVAGAPGHGFVGIWRDMRDGNAGLYFGRVDQAGSALEPERALYPEGSSSRELEPAIALSSQGNGAFVWYSSGSSAQSLKLRTFDASGRFHGTPTLIQDSRAAAQPAGRASAFGDSAASEGRRSGGGLRLPAIALNEEWGVVAWGESGTLWIQRFQPSGALIGEALNLSSPERPLSGPLRLCASRAQSGAKSGIVCAWTTREGVESALIGDAEFSRQFRGVGVLERLVAAPGSSAACWALVQTSAGHRLIEFAAAGQNPRSLELGISPRESCDVATHGARFLISVQHAGGAVELLTLDPSAAEPRPQPLAKLDVAGTVAGDLRVAGAGDRALVAWTGSVAKLSDVWLRTLDADGACSAAARWNTDEASSAQNHGRIASDGGDRAAIAWLDARSGENQLMARWIGANGQFLCDEFALTPRISLPAAQTLVLTGEPSEPAIAVASDGGFLLVWKQMEKRGYRLLGQAFDAAGKPQSQLLELDAGEDAPPTFKADLDVCSFGDGYAVAFGRKDRGVFVRRVLAGGRGMGEPVLIFEHPLCQHLALAELEGGTLAVAWDITVPGAGNQAVRARVLGPAFEANRALVEPPLSLFGDDWDPALAALPGGGFAIAFTGGKQHSRDVFLRLFDADGVVASPLVPISPRMNEQDWPSIVRLVDGSLIVAFEDDLSAYDHCYVRRVTKSTAGAQAVLLGPVLTLNERDAVLNENRVIPRIAALAGGGFAAVWVDCRRSKSTDVRVKIVGPKFDQTAR